MNKTGIPTALCEYPPGATKEQQAKALAIATSVHSSSGIALPQGFVLKFLESVFSGTTDYKDLHGFMNDAIAKVILSQTFSTEGAGGQYKGDNLMDVRDEVARCDADLLCQSFCGHNSPIWWLVWYNRSVLGEDVAVPKVWRPLTQPEDLKATADTWKILFDMGFEPDQALVQEKFGEGWLKKAPPNQIQPGDPENQPLELAEGDETEDTPDVFSEAIRGELGPIVDAWVERIQQELDAVEAEGGDLGAFGERLLALYPALNGEEFSEIMGQVLVAAQLAGQYEAQEGY